MALDRQSIEKKDFPLGRRGYEPASVDAHLAKLAREIESLQRAARSASSGASQAAPAAASAPSASLASIASIQVQAIVEAAETSADAIERDARDNAAQTMADASAEAEQIRADAIARSQDHVGKVREATDLMLQRVDAMESELGALVDSLRTGANRLSADLSLLSGSMGELYTAASGPDASISPVDYGPDVVLDEIDIVVVDEADADLAHDEPEAAAPREDDVEGARLIALNMALNGQTRDETDKYLAENFDLSDRAGLLDEVYATVEG